MENTTRCSENPALHLLRALLAGETAATSEGGEGNSISSHHAVEWHHRSGSWASQGALLKPAAPSPDLLFQFTKCLLSSELGLVPSGDIESLLGKLKDNSSSFEVCYNILLDCKSKCCARPRLCHCVTSISSDRLTFQTILRSDADVCVRA